jgi:hypothetical protein
MLLRGHGGSRHAVEGGRGDEEAQQVQRRRDRSLRDPAFGQQVPDPRGDDGGVGPARDGGERNAGQAAVPAGSRDSLKEQPGQALPPVAARQGGSGDRGHDVIEHGVQQIVPALYVDVKGGRAGIELLRDPAHAHRVEALPAGHAQGGRHDGGTAERGPDGTSPPAHRLTGTNAHAAKLTSLIR